MFNKDVKVPLQEAELVGTSSSNRCGVNLGGTVSSLNGLLERTQSMINSTINTGVMSRSSVSPGMKLMNKLRMLTYCLEGLYKVHGMEVK